MSIAKRHESLEILRAQIQHLGTSLFHGGLWTESPDPIASGKALGLNSVRALARGTDERGVQGGDEWLSVRRRKLPKVRLEPRAYEWPLIHRRRLPALCIVVKGPAQRGKRSLERRKGETSVNSAKALPVTVDER